MDVIAFEKKLRSLSVAEGAFFQEHILDPSALVYPELVEGLRELVESRVGTAHHVKLGII